MGLLQGRYSRPDERQPLSMAALLVATLRSPLELGGILLSVFVAAVLVTPLPPFFQPIVGLLLAAIPGMLLLARVRRRLEHERDQDPDDRGGQASE
ncbi:MAG TPA: hypothetical protein VE776_07530 [Actinomycetota bacterium]|jgi:membrane protein implicated in regulation of membrane protease activity|nr:hypothetical protein [Actinomycetota bacterium]